MLCCSQRRQWLCLTDQLNPLEANKVQIWTKHAVISLEGIVYTKNHPSTVRRTDRLVHRRTDRRHTNSNLRSGEFRNSRRLETTAVATREMSFDNIRVRHFDCFAIFQSFLRSVVTLKMF